jgi:phosphoglycolate phosphatase-like HAD superfamily hydrolase
VGTKHIVWDWNGTLLADNDAVLSAVNAVCAGFGRAAITIDHWRETFSRPLVQCYERLLEQTLDAAAWSRIDTIYHDHYRGLLSLCKLADGVPDHLRAWSDLGRSQSLLSMWYHHELVDLVTQHGIVDLFARVDGLRERAQGGSKATHLADHLAAQELDPADVVLIGDVVDDAEAAAYVGARCVLVTTGVMSRAKLEATGAPVVDSIPEALHRLDSH